ncbi:MAG: hypothetical protein N4A54_05295 [Peptostreptococcaceae bacterium]|jgi:translation elongation factor P/translation initiation factor 5A|nr:hypothetical protein [Peptostreptococcaceae bacterium]
MSKVSKISPTSKDRIRTMGVKRNTAVPGIEKVDKIKATNKTTNSTYKQNDNYTLSTTHFYNNIKKVKEEYLKFNDNKNNLKSNIEKAFEDEQKEILKILREFVKNYNSTISNLKKIDLAFNTSNTYKISKIFYDNKKLVGSIGLRLNPNHFLELNEVILKEAVIINHKSLDLFFDSEKGIIKQIYDEFSNLSFKEQHNLFSMHEDKEGLLLDTRF